MKKLALLIFLASAPAFAVCNPATFLGTGTNCNAIPDCPGTLNSYTPTAIPGTAWTQTDKYGTATTASVDCVIFEYNHPICPYASSFPFGCVIAYYFAHEVTIGSTVGKFGSPQTLINLHGGGFDAGSYQDTLGSPNGTDDVTRPVTIVQKSLTTPNADGTRGFAVALVDYQLAGSGGTGTNVFPAQWQSGKCAAWTLLGLINAGALPGSTATAGVYGPSAGAGMAFWVGETPDNAFTAACPVGVTAPSFGYRTVAAWMPGTYMHPFGNSGWEKSGENVSTIQPAFEKLMNCSSQATCQTASTALNIEPVSQITNANAAFLQRNPVMFQYGGSDTLINPYWGSPINGGNDYVMMQAYQSLSVPMNPLNIVYNGVPAGSIILAGQTANACGHECDLATVNYIAGNTFWDAVEFMRGAANPNSLLMAHHPKIPRLSEFGWLAAIGFSGR